MNFNITTIEDTIMANTEFLIKTAFITLLSVSLTMNVLYVFKFKKLKQEYIQTIKYNTIELMRFMELLEEYKMYFRHIKVEIAMLIFKNAKCMIENNYYNSRKLADVSNNKVKEALQSDWYKKYYDELKEYNKFFNQVK